MSLDLTLCPTCGSRSIHRICREVQREYEGQSYTVPELTFYLCSSCGEEVYDHEAMQKIEAYSPAYTKRQKKMSGSVV
jgi:YgiT-type zinc finger domain-containing protein